MRRLLTRRTAWFVAHLLTAALAPSVMAASDPAEGSFTIEGNVVHYSGALGPKTVKDLSKSAGSKNVRELVIRSEGGDALSGMRLGQWIRDNRIDVTVRDYCISACANYVFPAGYRKTIEKDALLLWHGGTNDKRARDLIDAFERALLRQAFNESDADDNELLSQQARTYQMFVLQIKLEASYFGRLGVDPYLTNMGREPEDFNALWTVSLETMRGFGISNVEGPADYGSRSHLERWRERYQPSVALMRLKRDKGGGVVIDW